MELQKIKVELLNPAQYNPRKDLKPGDKEYEKLKRSILEFGYVEPVIWNKRTGNVVGGHQRLKILMDEGLSEIDCVIVDLDEQREKALNIALNKIQGDWDENKLAALVAELDAGAFDVSLTGFDSAEIDELMNQWYSKEAVQDEFDIDKNKEEIEAAGAVTQKGDIWILGDHRLMCGDSTSAEDIERLMNSRHAQCAVTSPPYGVGKDYEKKGVEAWFDTIRPVTKNICRHADIVCWQMVDLYCTGSQFIEPTGFYSVQMFADNGFRPIWIRIWKKQGLNFGVGPYHLMSNKPVQQYEYISAFSKNGEIEEYNDQEYVWISAFAGHSFKFVKRLTKEERKKWGYAGIWEMTTVRANKEHPAMFPVELPWRCIWKPRQILNDKMTDKQFAEFLYKTFTCQKEVSEAGCMTYVVMSGQEWGNLMNVMADAGYHWSSTIIWEKDTLVLSRKDYHTQFEPIWYGWSEGSRLCPLSDRKQSDVWDIPRPKRSDEHPTMKPVVLVAKAIMNSSHMGDMVLDLFGGSGTTLIAADQTDRRCNIMELDPKYCDVIVKRYVENTQNEAGVFLLRGNEKIPFQKAQKLVDFSGV